MSSIRALVAGIQAEVLKGGMDPGMKCERLEALTALLGSANDESIEADAVYAGALWRAMEAGDAHNKAKARTEAGPEFVERQRARACVALVEELIRTLKVTIRNSTEEMKLGGR